MFHSCAFFVFVCLHAASPIHVSHWSDCWTLSPWPLDKLRDNSDDLTEANPSAFALWHSPLLIFARPIPIALGGKKLGIQESRLEESWRAFWRSFLCALSWKWFDELESELAYSYLIKTNSHWVYVEVEVQSRDHEAKLERIPILDHAHRIIKVWAGCEMRSSSRYIQMPKLSHWRSIQKLLL